MLNKLYLVTGGTGHLGSEVIHQLTAGQLGHVRALVLPGDDSPLPQEVEKIRGDITDKASMKEFFDRKGYDSVTLIHNAAMITIESKKNQLMKKVNIQGVRNVCEMALEYGVERMVHVSSVHAIPENGANGLITETQNFDPKNVVGQYAKSKAKASADVLRYGDQGLNVSIVHPSGIIGIGYGQSDSYMMQTILSLADNKVPISIGGGYDFVDVKDVGRGILQCEERGRPGETYILSGNYTTIHQMNEIIAHHLGKIPPKITIPLSWAKKLAPLGEKVALALNKKPTFTPYSMYTLGSNANFSHEKATKELNYQTRPLEDTVKETLTAYGYQLNRIT